MAGIVNERLHLIVDMLRLDLAKVVQREVDKLNRFRDCDVEVFSYNGGYCGTRGVCLGFLAEPVHEAVTLPRCGNLRGGVAFVETCWGLCAHAESPENEKGVDYSIAFVSICLSASMRGGRSVICRCVSYDVRFIVTECGSIYNNC